MTRGGPRRNRPSLLPMSLLSSVRETPNSYVAQASRSRGGPHGATLIAHFMSKPSPVQTPGLFLFFLSTLTDQFQLKKEPLSGNSVTVSGLVGGQVSGTVPRSPIRCLVPLNRKPNPTFIRSGSADGTIMAREGAAREGTAPSLLPMSLLSSARDTLNSYRAKPTVLGEATAPVRLWPSNL